ncbi:phage head closure protein [Shewanella oncorhynchi]|uniref:phage head closure protein n=1 Tax=Shewanella oncorhynchi TaxID=2726434 RepID=UPI003D7A30A8
MSSGNYRHRIDIYTATKQQDTLSGEELDQWTLAFQTMANFSSLSVRDFIAAAAAQSKISGEFTLHYRDGFPSEFRIKHAGKIYKPEGVMPDDKSGRKKLNIPVSESTDVLVG